MTNWTSEQLEKVGTADELELASRRADGSLRRFATIWAVRAGDDIFVRSAHGTENPWYRRAMASGSGRISAGGVELDVTFESGVGNDQEAIDAAYHAKYDHYSAQFVNPVVGDVAHETTIRVVPA